MPAATVALATYEADLARVRLDLSGFAAGTTSVQVVRRRLDTGAVRLVRGARSRTIANPAVDVVRMYDYEFPAGVPVRYEYFQAPDATAYPIGWTQLTATESGFEDGLGGWVASTGDLVVTSTTLARSGLSSLRLESVGVDLVEAKLTAGSGAQSDMTCAGLTSYRMAFGSRAGATSRGTQLGVNWFDAAGAYLSTDVLFLTDVVGAWTYAEQVVTSPPAARKVELFLQVLAPTVNTERHYFDDLAFGPVAVAPDVDTVWLKHPLRPYLNTPVSVRGYTPWDYQLRTELLAPVRSSVPIGRADVRAGRTFTVELDGITQPDRERLRDFLEVGGVWYWQPPGEEVRLPEGAYVLATDAGERRSGAVHSARRVFELTLAEVAPPAADSAASAITWQGVTDTWATWADLLAARSSWSELLSTVAVPVEVVVG